MKRDIHPKKCSETPTEVVSISPTKLLNQKMVESPGTEMRVRGIFDAQTTDKAGYLWQRKLR
jgi:hypothetical protein